MGRQIVTQDDIRVYCENQQARGGVAIAGIAGEIAPTPAAQTGAEPKLDTYQDRLLKYIPAEVVATYISLDGVLRSAPANVPVPALRWVVFVALLCGTWFYLRRLETVTRKQQLVVSTIAFAVWVFSLGGPFAGLHWYSPVYGALLLPLYTFGVASLPSDKEN